MSSPLTLPAPGDAGVNGRAPAGMARCRQRVVCHTISERQPPSSTPGASPTRPRWPTCAAGQAGVSRGPGRASSTRRSRSCGGPRRGGPAPARAGREVGLAAGPGVDHGGSPAREVGVEGRDDRAAGDPAPHVDRRRSEVVAAQHGGVGHLDVDLDAAGGRGLRTAEGLEDRGDRGGRRSRRRRGPAGRAGRARGRGRRSPGTPRGRRPRPHRPRRSGTVPLGEPYLT